MGNFAWMTALALSLAAPTPPQAQTDNPSPAHAAVTPTERAPDNAASDSKYSAFGAPNATAPDAGTSTTTTTRTTKTMKNHHRVLCADGSSPKTAAECKDHGGTK